MTKEEKERLVKENKWVVQDVINRYSHLMDRDELEAAGYYGLLEGIEKYREGNNTKMSTYARHWVKARVMGALYENRTVHLPWNKINSYIKEKRENPDSVGISGSYVNVDYVPKFEISLDSHNSFDNEDGNSSDNIEIQSSLSSQDLFIIEDTDKKNHVEFALNNSKLSDVEKKVVSLRFGLDRKENPMTLAQIATLTGLSVMGAQKAVNRALVKLKDDEMFRDLLE